MASPSLQWPSQDDYAVGAPVQIRVHEDKLKIWNPAVLPDGWTLEKLLGDHSSTPFNPDIANAFFRAGEHCVQQGQGRVPKAARRARRAERASQIEAWGRGIWRIFQACKEAGTPKPILRYEPNDLWMEFPFGAKYLKSISGHERGTPEVTPEVLRMVEVLHGAMSRAELMSALGLKDEKHFREHYQQAAVRAGLIEMTQPKSPRSPTQKYRLTADRLA